MREGAVADGIVLYQVGIITLNRPEKLNAISRELQLALTEAFARADADPATSAERQQPALVGAVRLPGRAQR